MKQFAKRVLEQVVGSLIYEAFAPFIRERAERRRLVNRRARFRQPCAGPDADYCELHGECYRCCEASGGKVGSWTCPFHGNQP